MNRQLQYIVPADYSNSLDSIECPLCYDIPNRAKSLPCCEQRICSLCAKKWFKRHSTCPFCRSDIDQQVKYFGLPDCQTQLLLFEWDVMCPFKDCGCDWILQRKHIHEHLKNNCELFNNKQLFPKLKLSDFALLKHWKRLPKESLVDDVLESDQHSRDVIISIGDDRISDDTSSLSTSSTIEQSISHISFRSHEMDHRTKFILISRYLHIFIVLISITVIVWILIKNST